MRQFVDMFKQLDENLFCKKLILYLLDALVVIASICFCHIVKLLRNSFSSHWGELLLCMCDILYC